MINISSDKLKKRSRRYHPFVYNTCMLDLCILLYICVYTCILYLMHIGMSIYIYIYTYILMCIYQFASQCLYCAMWLRPLGAVLSMLRALCASHSVMWKQCKPEELFPKSVFPDFILMPFFLSFFCCAVEGGSGPFIFFCRPSTPPPPPLRTDFQNVCFTKGKT